MAAACWSGPGAASVVWASSPPWLPPRFGPPATQRWVPFSVWPGEAGSGAVSVGVECVLAAARSDPPATLVWLACPLWPGERRGAGSGETSVDTVPVLAAACSFDPPARVAWVSDRARPGERGGTGSGGSYVESAAGMAARACGAHDLRNGSLCAFCSTIRRFLRRSGRQCTLAPLAGARWSVSPDCPVRYS